MAVAVSDPPLPLTVSGHFNEKMVYRFAEAAVDAALGQNQAMHRQRRENWTSFAIAAGMLPFAVGGLSHLLSGFDSTPPTWELGSYVFGLIVGIAMIIWRAMSRTERDRRLVEVIQMFQGPLGSRRLGNYTYVADVGGFRVQSPAFSTLIPWTCINSIRDDDAWIAVHSLGVLFCMIPKSFFDTPTNAAAFVSTCRRLANEADGGIQQEVRTAAANQDVYCPRCGFNLRATTGAGCPECGMFVTVPAPAE